jgi:glycosyltransferase involved in cell wall biosynthesis
MNQEKKIKVLFAINNLNIGGAEKLVISQIKHLDRNKFEPQLCTLFPDGPNNYSAQAAALPDAIHHKFFFRGPWDIFSWVKIWLCLRREKFDILCCNLFEANLIIRLVNIFAGAKPIFIFEHNTYWQKQWWKILADRWLSRKTARIFGDSQAVLDFTAKQEKISPDKFAVMPYPIELPEQEDFDRAKTKKDLGLPADSFVVGAVARFVEQKGLEYFIKAAAKVINDCGRPDIYFLLVGYGKLELELKKLVVELGISSKFIIRPARDIKEVLPILDVFVVSSLWEAQPISMLEAMAAGCAVVATKVGGIPEILAEGRNGLLVESKDEWALAEKIVMLVKNNELRHNISKGGRLTAMNFSLPSYIKKLEKYFIDEYEASNKY